MDFKLGEKIIQNISKVVVGKSEALELLLVGLLANGHVLLEDVPGVGKTLVTKSLAKSFEGTVKKHFPKDDAIATQRIKKIQGDFYFEEDKRKT